MPFSVKRSKYKPNKNCRSKSHIFILGIEAKLIENLLPLGLEHIINVWLQDDTFVIHCVYFCCALL